MTSQEIAGLVGAVIALLTALQGWLAYRSVAHGKQLNGLMAPRIARGAAAVVVADHVARGEVASPQVVPVIPVDPVKAARVAALQAELAELTKPS